jgi:hypothetical protein
MDDKQAQPSTTFDTSISPLHLTDRLTFSSSSSSFQSLHQPIAVINRKPDMDFRPRINAMSSLLSPPEAKPYESFSRTSPDNTMASQIPSAFPKALTQFPSPPVSPETKNSGPDRSSNTLKDPILYPSQDPSSPQPPLFEVQNTFDERLVDQHMSARAARKRQFRESSPPNRDDYVLALEFKSQVAKMFKADPKGWHIRERRQLIEDQRIRSAASRKLLPAPTGIVKATPHRRISSGNKEVTRPRLPKVRQAPAPKPQRLPSTTPEPGRVRINAGTTREDRDFESLPDYSPPLSTLPNRPNSLKVEWKGAPIDLSQDPHRHLLHPDEVALAANLRLDCATYLTSKRRIFIGRIECMRRGKEFRKTDSQQACKIDVNKASKLWSAFEKVGWLRKEFFLQYA